jgi:hypothetical protein
LWAVCAESLPLRGKLKVFPGLNLSLDRQITILIFLHMLLFFNVLVFNIWLQKRKEKSEKRKGSGLYITWKLVEER